MRRGIQLLGLACIAILLLCLSTRAQTNVYSVNAVGYVQVAFQPGYNYCCNPLNTTNNSVSGLFSYAPPDGCAVSIWDVDAQRFSAPAVFHGSWSTNYPLPLGKGFVVYTPTKFTNTFVGEVMQGILTNRIVGGNRLSLLSSIVPQMGQLRDLNVPAVDGDTVYMPVATTQRLSDAYNYFGSYGWFDPTGAANTNGPVLPVGGCFFMQHAGADMNWVRVFSINNTPQRTTAAITNIKVSDARVTLSVSVPPDSVYDVQTSVDRVTWTTVATKQSSASWSCDTAKAAYFRLQ